MQQIIHLHRRHNRHCALGRQPGSYTAETEEDPRRPVCSCPITASGTLNGVHRRVATKQKTWVDARAMVEPSVEAGDWGAERSPLQLRLAVASKTGVEEAMAMVLRAQEDLNAAVQLLRTYQRSRKRS